MAQVFGKLPTPSSGQYSPLSSTATHAYYARKRTKARGGVQANFHSPHPGLGVTMVVKSLKIA